MRVQLYNAVLFLSMDYKKDIFAVFAYEFELSQILNLKNVKVKDESCNPYGTHKDRRSEYIVNVALENKVDKVVCLTAGNAGYSLSRYCARARINYTSIVFPWISKERIIY